MTKKEQKQVNAFLFRLIKSKNRRFIPASVFDKRSKPGSQLVVLPLKTILREFAKMVKEVENK